MSWTVVSAPATDVATGDPDRMVLYSGPRGTEMLAMRTSPWSLGSSMKSHCVLRTLMVCAPTCEAPTWDPNAQFVSGYDPTPANARPQVENSVPTPVTYSWL